MTDAYRRAADRALQLAQRMAGVAADVLAGWKAADRAKADADLAVNAAKADVTRLEGDVADANDAVGYLKGFAAALALDVAAWRTVPDTDPVILDGMLDDVAQRLAAARLAKGQAEGRLKLGRAALVAVTDRQSNEVNDARVNASAVASSRAGEVTAGETEAHGLDELRTLAGGVEEADHLLGLATDPAALASLLRSLGATVATEWLTASDLGPSPALEAVRVFGEAGLRDLNAGIAGKELWSLLTGLGAPRLHDLVGALTLGGVKDLAATFTPSEIGTLATTLGPPGLATLVAAVSPKALKALGLAADKLVALLAEVPGAALGALIAALGADKAKQLIGQFSAPALKALLAKLPPDAMAVLDTTAMHLKALLKSFGADELKDFGLTGAQFKAVLGVIDATALKLLATDVTHARVKELVVAFSTVADLKALLTAVGNAGQTILLDLFTQFTAAEIRDYRTNVGPPRFKELLVTRAVPAAALHHFGAPMMKTFVGAGAKAWKHATTAKISATSGQISGAHDATVFDDFVNGQAPGEPAGDTNATVHTSVATTHGTKVTYT
ncbi:MAG: hypothetical protein ACRDZW_08460, partial [Acidimicrobiales bacterium]